jgi:hypothetical protein
MGLQHVRFAKLPISYANLIINVATLAIPAIHGGGQHILIAVALKSCSPFTNGTCGVPDG